MDINKKFNMDKIDLKILSILQNNGNITNSELANSISLSTSATSERVKKLEANKFITSYKAHLGTKKLGLEFDFITKIKLKNRSNPMFQSFVKTIKNNNHIAKCHQIVHEDWNLLISGTVKSINNYLEDVIAPLEETSLIEKIDTITIVDTFKETGIFIKDIIN